MYEYAKRPSKFKKFILTFLSLVAVSAGSIFIYSMYLKIEVNNYTPISNTTATRLYNDAVVEEDDINNSLEEITRSIVGISKIKNKGTTILDLNAPKELGLGSGIIFAENGYIITNWHVAGDKFSTCYVTLENGNSYNGSVVWEDSDLDLAIVKINAAGLKAINLGDSEKIKLGDEVWAIGNPVGVEFQRTITKGIVSGLNRTIKIDDEDKDSYMEDLIQTDASINTGNSGGALVNKKGELIGVNTIKITSAEGIGFAVPINIVKPVITSFIQKGSFEEAYLRNFCIRPRGNKIFKFKFRVK